MGGEGRAVEQVADVDDEGGDQQDQGRRATADQLHGDELRRSGEDDRGHGEGEQRRDAGGNGQHAKDEAEGHGSNDDRQLGAESGEEVGAFVGRGGLGEFGDGDGHLFFATNFRELSLVLSLSKGILDGDRFGVKGLGNVLGKV
jgi:hypothetical protein